MEKLPEEKKKEPASLEERRRKTLGFSRQLPKGMDTARVVPYEEFIKRRSQKSEMEHWKQERKERIKKYHLPASATDKDIENKEREERGADKEIEIHQQQKEWEIDHGMN